jgi:hypothetical protein
MDFPLTVNALWTALAALGLGLVGGFVAGLMPKDDTSTAPADKYRVWRAAFEGGIAAVVILLVRSKTKNVEFIAQGVLAGLVGRPLIDALKTSILNQVKAAHLRELAKSAKAIVAASSKYAELPKELRRIAVDYSDGAPAAEGAIERLEQLDRFVREVAGRAGR